MARLELEFCWAWLYKLKHINTPVQYSKQSIVLWRLATMISFETAGDKNFLQIEHVVTNKMILVQ